MKNEIKNFVLLIMAIVCVAVMTGAASAAETTIDKTTIVIRTSTTYDFNRSTEQRGWLPYVDFRVNGPIASGSQISVEMTKPDGKPWIEFDCDTEAIKDGAVLKIDGCGNRLPNEKFTGALGVHGLKINLKNELKGVNQNLFSGKFKVGKVFNGANPKDKDNYVWYVDYDWSLPIAEVYAEDKVLQYGSMVENQLQPLVATFWFRGNPPTTAYLFHNGEQLASTETSTEGTLSTEQSISVFDTNPYGWTKKKYTFTRMLVKNLENPDNHPNFYRMDKNPGEYEVKVLIKGKLARAVKFTVSSDGRIVDTGISRQNALGTKRITLYANVTGDDDGKTLDLTGYKTTAFFDSPLKGFGE